MVGGDTFAWDLEGYGRSTRQPTMEIPEAYPQAKSPTSTDLAVDNVARIADFIRGMRGVEKVYLMGWSLGASRVVPIYSIQHSGRVAKIALFAPGYRNLGWVENFRGAAPSLAATAKALALGERTLRRRLEEEGTSHRALVDEVRKELALSYVRDTSLSLGELAFLLGFSEAAAFHRAFRRWTGQRPAELRARLSRGDEP